MEHFYEEDEGTQPQSQMECETCGGTEFISEGGFFYCTICNVQSQQSRVYVEDEEAQVAQAFTLTRVQKLQKERKEKRNLNAAPEQCLSSWEVHNLVLKVMTDKLIELGFPPLLRDKTFQIWKQFLLRREVILVPNPQNKAVMSANDLKMNFRAFGGKAAKPFCRKRLIPAPEKKKVEEDYNPSVTKRRKTYARKAAFHHAYMEKQRLEKEKAEPPGPPPFQLTAQSKILLKDFPDSRETYNNLIKGRIGIEQSAGYIRTGNILKPESFGLINVLITLFVACRQIGCRVLFTDIHRLFIDGTLNIRSLRTILGEETFNQYNNYTDQAVKRYVRTFDVGNVCHTIENFINYVGIQYFEYPTFQEFLPKFIDDLRLPRELEGLIVQFHKMFLHEEFTLSANPNPNLHTKFNLQEYRILIEIEILCTILLVSKMLFGFDDHTEIHQAKFARTVNQLMSKYGKNQNSEDDAGRTDWSPDFNHCFIVEDWFTHLRTRIHLLDHELFSFVNYRYGGSWDTNVCRTNEIVNRFMAHARNRREKSKKSFEELRVLFEEGGSVGVGDVMLDVPDYMSLPLPNTSPLQQYLTAYPSVSFPEYGLSSHTPTILQSDFSKTRIDFVYNPYKYIGLLERGGYKVELRSGSANQPANSAEIEANTHSKTLYLFQPYKHFDYSSVERLETSDGAVSMDFLLEVSTKYLFDREQHSRPLLNFLAHLSRCYRLRSAHRFIPLPNIEPQIPHWNPPMNIQYLRKQIEIDTRKHTPRHGMTYKNTKKQRLLQSTIQNLKSKLNLPNDNMTKKHNDESESVSELDITTLSSPASLPHVPSQHSTIPEETEN